MLQGQLYLTPLLTKDVLRTVLKPPTGMRDHAAAMPLTARQREVLQLVAQGYSTKVIASMLNLHVKTVEFHKWRIMAKLDLHSSEALTRYAVARGLTEI